MTASWIIDQLLLQGVEHFFISPGSRSTPLALAVAEQKEVKTWVHFDERGLGFLALGFGKGTKKPAALIVTSGTAVGNLFPSVMEACHSFTPLIVLTADRPHELQDCGSNQTCDQLKLFGKYVRFQFDLPVLSEEKYVRSTIQQAVFGSLQNPPGPVHVNCRFKEPFYPLPVAKQPGKRVEHFFPRLTPDPKALRSEASRGVFLLGEIPESPRPILELARKLQWPVFADILSQARCKVTEEQIKGYDDILRQNPPLTPDLIIHFGERVLSKTLLTWQNQTPTWHVSPYPFLQDPERRNCVKVQCDIALFCEHFQAKTDLKWLKMWKSLEPKITPHPLKVPKNTVVFLGNSLPIRQADASLYPEECAGFYCNRGLSGIDGNIATSVGLAIGLQKQVVALIGDQACLHDLNSLCLLHTSPFPVHLIVENNFGGQIFTQFPVSASPYFDRFWAASHTWHFENAARMFGLPYFRGETLPEEFGDTSSIIEWISVKKPVRVFS